MRQAVRTTTVSVSSTGRPSATQPAPRFGLARKARAWRPHAGWEWGRTDGVSRGSRLAVYAEGGSSQVSARAFPKAGPIAWIEMERLRLMGKGDIRRVRRPVEAGAWGGQRTGGAGGGAGGGAVMVRIDNGSAAQGTATRRSDGMGQRCRSCSTCCKRWRGSRAPQVPCYTLSRVGDTDGYRVNDSCAAALALR